MNTNADRFTGKADSYASARPGYPDAAVAYILSIARPNAVFADIGAGTGKMTEPLARRGAYVYAVEPNADMRQRLTLNMAPFKHAAVVDGTAEATTLPGRSVDAIVCAQALHWFDLDAFRLECLRIGRPGRSLRDGRPGVLVIAVYNNTPGGSSVTHSRLSTEAFFTHPEVREFANPQAYTREGWLAYMTSHSGDPLPTDDGYATHLAEVNAMFDREGADGLLRRDVVTKVFSEWVA
jgi:SAM-dependent methyltransferase